MKKAKKEAEYKEKVGTAWSHSYLNQKPWHPLSYPNQRRKWIAEQTHAQREERKEEVAREFAQEQEFFRQTAMMSKKEKEKMEARQAVSFMYMRPPGYNAEAARAAEIADERKKLGLTTSIATSATAADANGNVIAVTNDRDSSASIQEKSKPRQKDVFGRTLPTEQEFPALKNAPRHDTGVATRVKPFAIEIRNVKCARCGAFGHQSGDRECPLKEVLMPNEEARLIREDPLNVIMAQTVSDQGLNWELKQKPGLLSPARGGFKPDDPNQQIIPDENIYDEYGGFLPGGANEGLSIPNLLASLSHGQRKHLTDAKIERKQKRKERKGNKGKRKHSRRRKFESSSDSDQVESSYSESSEDNRSSQRLKAQKERKGRRQKGKRSAMRNSRSSGFDDPGWQRYGDDLTFESSDDDQRNHTSQDRKETEGKTQQRQNKEMKEKDGERKHSERKYDSGADDLGRWRQFSAQNSENSDDQRSRRSYRQMEMKRNRRKPDMRKYESSDVDDLGRWKYKDKQNSGSSDNDNHTLKEQKGNKGMRKL